MSGVNNEEDKKPGTGDGAHINLKVKGQDGNEVFFRIKRSTQLKKLMNAYCDRQSVELNSIAFLFDGRRLRGEQTPDELEMEEGDEIDAMLHQTGDLVGGYYDAGDNIKFGLPMAFTVTMLSWSVLEYHEQIAAAWELYHALEAIKWGTDYFIKAHTHPHKSRPLGSGGRWVDRSLLLAAAGGHDNIPAGQQD